MSSPEDGEEVDDGCATMLAATLLPFATTSGFVQFREGQKSSSVNPTLLERQSALLASLVDAMGDKRLSQSTGREALEKAFRMKFFFLSPWGVGVKRRIHRFRDVCGQCLSITGALVQLDNKLQG